MRKRRRKEIRNENLNARRWCGRYCGWNRIKIQVVTYSLVFEVVSVVANNFHVFWAVLLVWEIQNAQRWERERGLLLFLAIVWLRPCLGLRCMLIHSEFERIKSVSRDSSMTMLGYVINKLPQQWPKTVNPGMHKRRSISCRQDLFESKSLPRTMDVSKSSSHRLPKNGDSLTHKSAIYDCVMRRKSNLTSMELQNR